MKCPVCKSQLLKGVVHKTHKDCVDALVGRNEFLKSENRRLEATLARRDAALVKLQQEVKKFSAIAEQAARLNRLEDIVAQVVAKGKAA